MGDLFSCAPYWTPYDDDYPASERTTSELRIYSLTMAPDEITSILELRPTLTAVMGHPVVPPEIPLLGPPRPRSRHKHHVWALNSEAFVQSLDLRRHLDWLLEKIEPAAAGLRQIRQAEKTLAVVDCKWWMRKMGGPVLWPRQMRLLSDLDLELALDISFYGDDAGVDAP